MFVPYVTRSRIALKHVISRFNQAHDVEMPCFGALTECWSLFNPWWVHDPSIRKKPTKRKELAANILKCV